MLVFHGSCILSQLISPSLPDCSQWEPELGFQAPIMMAHNGPSLVNIGSGSATKNGSTTVHEGPTVPFYNPIPARQRSSPLPANSAAECPFRVRIS